MDISTLLNERGNTHGDYKDVAKVTFQLLSSITKELDDELKLALFMIVHKIARIQCGNERELDHWRDIAGYAQLAIDYLEASKSNTTIQDKLIPKEMQQAFNKGLDLMKKSKEAREKVLSMYPKETIEVILKDTSHPMYEVTKIARDEGSV